MEAMLSSEEAAKALGLPPRTLLRMAKRAPLDLPGGPLRVGDGAERWHFRWRPDTLTEWLDAYRSWDAKRARGLVVIRPVLAAPAQPAQRRSRGTSLLAQAKSRATRGSG